MSLRLICGRSGTGKSQFCLEEIEEKRKQNNKIYIITPEQFSYAEEKKLLETMSSDAAIEVEVLTFARMAHRVSSKVGSVTKRSLTKPGKAMLIYNLLSKKKDNFTFLGKSKQNVDIIETQITEFKKHGITIEMLQNCKEEIDDKYLQSKLDDMILIYQDYQDKIKDSYIEENDRLTMLCNQLEETQIFKDAIFYIDEFVGFTKQEYDIIEKLLKMAKEVNITITTDNLDMGTSKDTDIFYYNKQTADKLLYIARKQNIECEKTVFLNDTYRFKNEELKHLEKNLNKIPYNQYNKNMENIKLYLASNPYLEIEKVAKEIIKLVRENNYRYRDIAIITKDLERYSSICKAIFASYEIPVFIDEKKDLSQNILIKYLISILDIFAQSWSLESVMNYIKTGFLDIEDEEIYIFENKVRKWGIKGSKWYNGEWNFEEETDENRAMLHRIKELREKIVIPLKEFKDDLSKGKTAEEITKRLYEFLIQNNIDKAINKIQREQEIEYELVEEYKLTWNIVVDLLDEINLLFDQEKMSFERYLEIIRIGLNNSSPALIPQTQDQVLLGDVERSKSHKVKAIFLIGINDGIFPSVYKKEGFFQDNDREKLKQKGVELAKTTIERLYEDNFSIYKVFTIAEEKLYISYSSSDMEGKALRPSIFITKLKKIFLKLKEESDMIENNNIEFINLYSTFEDLIEQLSKANNKEDIDSIWNNIYSYYNSKEEWKDKLDFAIKALEKNNVSEKITDENIEKLYGKKLSTTISRLEQYRRCPFSYHLKYGLKLTTQDNFKIQAIDTGTFMHDVIDTFFKTIREEDLKVKELEANEIAELVNRIVNEKLSYTKNYIFTSTDKYKVLTNRLKRLITKSMKYMIDGLKNSDFEVFETEAEFKDNAKYKPIEILLDNGKKIELTGKIDRIDLAKTQEGDFIRIIDYKSSIKNIDLNEVVAGLQIQLLTYLDATCKNEDVMPAGILYYNLIEPILKSDKIMNSEQIEEEIRKKFKMQGLILADVNIVKKMDKTLEKGQSNRVPAYIDKDGNLSKAKSNAISKEEFELLQEYTKKTIKQISEEILSGNIKKEPYYSKKTKKTPCEYCEFKSICNFKEGECDNKYRFIDNKKKEEILYQIKEKNK